MDVRKDLQERISDARSILIPKFSITPQEQAMLHEPGIELWDGRTQYTLKSNQIQFNRKDLENPLAIGEETAHYIHLSLNPLTIDRQTDLFDVLPLLVARELVGRYGALVYMSVKGISIDTWKRTEGLPDSSSEWLDYLSHSIGYERAYKLFDLHRDRYLAQVARMNPHNLIDFSRRVAPVSWYERRIVPLVDRLCSFPVKAGSIR